MSGKPAIVMQAVVDMNQQFTPDPTYWITFSTDFVEGEVLNSKGLETMKIVFPPNEYKLSLSFTENSTWVVID